MRNKQRVCFDTNIYISAFLLPNSQAQKALTGIIEGPAVLVISKEIIGELISVLSRKFSKDREELSRIAVFLSDICEVVQPDLRIDILKDEPDNRILECAAAGGANIIVTGDKEMLALESYNDINIITLNKFISDG